MNNNLNPVYIRQLWDEAEKEETFMGRFDAITRIVSETEPFPQMEDEVKKEI